eukprot:6440439-Amphidinium_carterae.1
MHGVIKAWALGWFQPFVVIGLVSACRTGTFSRWVVPIPSIYRWVVPFLLHDVHLKTPWPQSVWTYDYPI